MNGYEDCLVWSSESLGCDGAKSVIQDNSSPLNTLPLFPLLLPLLLLLLFNLYIPSKICLKKCCQRRILETMVTGRQALVPGPAPYSVTYIRCSRQ